jgi:3-dehydroquinate dehydratase-2
MSMTTQSETARPLALVLNGPNLNLLGIREPHLYGTAALDDVEREVGTTAESLGWDVEFVQSNHEGALIDAVQSARGRASAILLNPGGLAHTSVSLRDAIASVEIPTVEVHVTNVHSREAFRHHSYVSAVATGVIVGAGIHGYVLALELVAHNRQASAA